MLPNLKFLIIVLLIVFAANALAETDISFGEPPLTPQAISYPIPQFQFLDEEFYRESFSFVADLDDGCFFQAQFGITNIGIGDNKPNIRVVYVDANGERKQEIINPDGDVKNGSRGIILGDNSIVYENGAYRISVKGEEMSFEAVYEPLGPAVRPGDGRLDFDDGFYEIVILFTRARLSGTLNISGQTINLKGYATANNSYSTSKSLGLRWFRYMKIKEDPAVIFTVFYPDGGGKETGWLIETEGKKITRVETHVGLSFSGFEKIEQSRYGYLKPINTAARIKDDSTFHLEIRNMSLIFIQDIMDEMSAAIGLIFQRFVQPESFTFRATDGRLVEGNTSMPANALVEITFVKKK